MRFCAFIFTVFAAGLAPVGAWAAETAAAPAALMSAAECMARVLQGQPGVTKVQVDVQQARRGAYPVLSYSFGDAAGTRRYTEISLFEISGIDDAPFVFDRADIENDPMAEKLLPVWKTRCRSGLGYITSVPR